MLRSTATRLTHLAAPWRLRWIVVVLAIQSLYLPINRMAQGGRALKTPLDDLIPIWPIWVVPYTLCLAWWLACLVWAARDMDDTLYLAFVVSLVAAMLTSYAVYLIYPTFAERPVLAGDRWDIQWLRWIYRHDRPYNAFPSSHTFHACLIYFFWRKWHPRQTWLWGTIALLVLCSTLFTHQHHLPDLIGGASVAWLSYRLGLWWATREPRGA